MLELEALPPPPEEELEWALIRIPAEESGVIRLSDPLIRNQLRPPMAPWFSI